MKTKSSYKTFVVTVKSDHMVYEVQRAIADTLTRYKKAAKIESVKVTRPREKKASENNVVRMAG